MQALLPRFSSPGFSADKVLAFSEGNDTMKKIAAAIRQGANAYLKHQYATVAKVFFVVFLILLLWLGGVPYAG